MEEKGSQELSNLRRVEMSRRLEYFKAIAESIKVRNEYLVFVARQELSAVQMRRRLQSL